MIHVVVTIFEQQDLKLKGCSTNQWPIELTPWVSSSFVCDQRWRCDVNSHSSGLWLSLGAVLVAAADIGSHRESAGDRITELVTLSVTQQQVLRSWGRAKIFGKIQGGRENRVLIDFVMHEQTLHFGPVYLSRLWQFLVRFCWFHLMSD